MKQTPLLFIEIDPLGRFQIGPKLGTHHLYEYIYREASGLRWNRERAAFCASEPSRWEHAELFAHVAATLRSTFGENLLISKETTWSGVPQDLKAKLQESLSSHPDAQ